MIICTFWNLYLRGEFKRPKLLGDNRVLHVVSQFRSTLIQATRVVRQLQWQFFFRRITQTFSRLSFPSNLFALFFSWNCLDNFIYVMIYHMKNIIFHTSQDFGIPGLYEIRTTIICEPLTLNRETHIQEDRHRVTGSKGDRGCLCIRNRSNATCKGEWDRWIFRTPNRYVRDFPRFSSNLKSTIFEIGRVKYISIRVNRKIQFSIILVLMKITFYCRRFTFLRVKLNHAPRDTLIPARRFSRERDR